MGSRATHTRQPSVRPARITATRVRFSSSASTLTLDGRTYTATGSAEVAAQVTFRASVTMPPFTARGADKISAPFTFTGGFFSDLDGVRATFTGEVLSRRG